VSPCLETPCFVGNCDVAQARDVGWIRRHIAIDHTLVSTCSLVARRSWPICDVTVRDEAWRPRLRAQSPGRGRPYHSTCICYICAHFVTSSWLTCQWQRTVPGSRATRALTLSYCSLAKGRRLLRPTLRIERSQQRRLAKPRSQRCTPSRRRLHHHEIPIYVGAVKARTLRAAGACPFAVAYERRRQQPTLLLLNRYLHMCRSGPPRDEPQPKPEILK